MTKGLGNGAPRELGDVVSIIGPGMKITGDCESDGTIRVEGSIEGAVKAAKSVVVGKDGIVIGDIDSGRDSSGTGQWKCNRRKSRGTPVLLSD